MRYKQCESCDYRDTDEAGSFMCCELTGTKCPAHKMAKEDKWLPEPIEIGDVLQTVDMDESVSYPCSNGDVICTLDVMPIAKFTAKKIHDEGNKPCPHFGSEANLKRECKICWQSLGEVE